MLLSAYTMNHDLFGSDVATTMCVEEGQDMNHDLFGSDVATTMCVEEGQDLASGQQGHLQHCG